jgi:tetratricopeptide (TPR) repeat protein
MRHWRRIRELIGPLEESTQTLRLRREACGAVLQIGLRVGLPVEERRALMEEVKQAAYRLGDIDAGDRAVLAAMPAAIQVMEGEGEGPVRVLREARELALAADDGSVVIAISALLAVAHLFAGRLAECLEVTDAVVGASLTDPQLGSGIFTTNPSLLLLVMRANALRELGRLDEARTTAERVVALARELDDPENLVLACASLVDLWLERGEPGATLDLAREAVQAAERLGSLFARSMAYCSVGLSRAASGKWPEARDAYEQSLVLLRQSHFGVPDEPFRLANLAQALAHCGDLERARSRADEALELARVRGVRLASILALRVRAEILMLERSPSALMEAERSLGTALEIARESGARTLAAFVQVDLAAAAWRADDSPRCQAHLRSALEELREIGATGQVAQLEEALSALGRAS